jgi:hypothetical protein
MTSLIMAFLLSLSSSYANVSSHSVYSVVLSKSKKNALLTSGQIMLIILALTDKVFIHKVFWSFREGAYSQYFTCKETYIFLCNLNPQVHTAVNTIIDILFDVSVFKFVPYLK